MKKSIRTAIICSTILGCCSCSSCDHFHRTLDAASVKFSINISNDVNVESDTKETKETEEKPEKSTIGPNKKPSAETDAQLQEFGGHAFANIRRRFLQEQEEEAAKTDGNGSDTEHPAEKIL